MDLEIISVNTPSEASAGQTVNVAIYAYNSTSSRIFAIVTARVDNTEFVTTSYFVQPGAQRVFTFPFIMPSRDVTIMCWVWIWNFATGAWSTTPEDEHGPVTVSLTGGGGPGLQAEITDIRVNNLPYPVSLNAGDTFLVQFKGRNKSTSNISLKSSIIIKNPNGRIEYQGTDSEWPMWTGPNGTHQFIYPKTTPITEPRVLADVPGIWKADIYLYDHGTGEELDRELGVAVADVGEVTETYKVEIQSPQIRECNGEWKSLTQDPVLVAGKEIQIRFTARNTGTAPVNIWGTVEVSSPSGPAYSGEDDREGSLAVGQTHQFTFPRDFMCKIGVIDEEGSYTVSIGLDIAIGGARQTADTKEYSFSASEEGVGGIYVGKITDIEIDWGDLPGGGIPIGSIVSMPVGENIRISFQGWYDSGPTTMIKLRGELWLYDPDGEVAFHDIDTSTVAYTRGSAHSFVFPSPPFATPISKEGLYTIKIKLTNSSGEYTLAEYQTPEGGGVPSEVPPAGTWSIISSIMPLMMMMMLMSMLMPMMQGFGEGAE